MATRARPRQLSTQTEPLCEAFDVAMLDLDGVVYVGEHAVPGAAAALEAAASAGMTLAYVTNNASRSPGDIADQLGAIGMPEVSARDVVTSAQAASRLIAELVPAGSHVLVVGGPGLREAVSEHQLVPTSFFDDDCAGVVQGFHPDVDWRLLAEGTYAVASGLPWVASNMDLTIPTARGRAPGNGTLVKIIAATTGKRPVVAGKPEIALFHETVLRVGGEHPLVVGDRLDTDIRGASRADARSLLVFTGVTNLAEVSLAEGDDRPSFVSPDLRGLLRPQPPVRISGDTAQCGDVLVHHTFGRMRVRSERPDLTDLVRASVALAWSYLDRGGDRLDISQPQQMLSEMMDA